MASGDTKTESYLRAAAEGTRADLPSDTCCNTKTQNLILGVANRIMDVEDEVEELKNNPDVADIVNTYADLQNYDTSTLTDKDVIRVLQDETHDGDSTYYRYSTNTGEFTYVGESKQYTDFVGTDGTSAGESGLVPAPTVADVDKFLKSDGTWDVVGGGPTVVQTTGTSTTDVMSQNATTSMVYADPGTNIKIQIGNNSNAIGREATAIGYYSSAQNWGTAIGTGSSAGGESVGVGRNAIASTLYSVAVGAGARVENVGNSVALGASASATRKGEVNVGTGMQTTWGYDNTPYRVIGGVHDPVDAHDAATKGYVDANASSATFYMSVTPYPYTNLSGVSLYSDIALTTAVPASTFVQALRNCKSVFLVYKSGDSDWMYRYIAQIIGSYMPNADTVEAYDEAFPAGYYFDGTTGNRYMIQSATSDPDDTASFDIEKLN